MTETSRHVRRNRRSGDASSDGYRAEHASQLNRWDLPVWRVGSDLSGQLEHAVRNFAGLAWARRWPAQSIWTLRKRV